MPDDAVGAVLAKDDIPDQNAFRNIMEETAEAQKQERQEKSDNIKIVNKGGEEGNNYYNIPQIAPVKDRALFIFNAFCHDNPTLLY
jgi:hypothetical protein